MGCCGRCLSVLLLISVLALSGTLLCVGISELTGFGAKPLDRLDERQYHTMAIWTTSYGAIGLLLGLLAHLSCCSPPDWRLLLTQLVMLLALFVAARWDDITGHPAGGDLANTVYNMNSSLAEYPSDSAVENAWDSVQHRLHCCGVTSGADWSAVLGSGHVPDSCCRADDASVGINCTVLHGSFTQGCAVAVHSLIADRRAWSVALATASASLILLLLVVAGAAGFCGGDGSSHSGGRTQANLDNHANQLNPNNWRYQGRGYQPI